MQDQAANLRRKLVRRNGQQGAKTLAIVSGKGGVGKSNIALNFALSLCQENKKVLLFDLDIGMGNIDVLLGKSSLYSIADMLENNLSMYDIIELGPLTLSYVAGGNGYDHIFDVTEEKFLLFLDKLEVIFKDYDFILFDMGAGMTRDSLNFILSVDECIAVTTPEPAALTDVYSMIKYIVRKEALPFHLIINRAADQRQGIILMNRVMHTVKRFLQQDITPLGVIPEDRAVTEAAFIQQPFLLHKPKSQASIELKQMTKQFLGEELKERSDAGFLSKLKRLFKER